MPGPGRPRKLSVNELLTIQRREALVRANRIRSQRKVIREKMRAGVIDPVKLIEGNYTEHERAIGAWKLHRCLQSIPMVGPITAGEILRVAGLNPDTRLGDLSFAQRKVLAGLVRETREVVIDVA